MDMKSYIHLKKIDLLPFLIGVVGNPKYKLIISKQGKMSIEND